MRSREVNNRLILEGALRVYWGVQGVIHLKEDDDQRTFVVRKRNSCRVSKADQDSSDKENNDGSESLEVGTTTSDQVDAISTDTSLTESMSFDSCSLNEFPDLPTTPEDASANTTGTQTITNGGGERNEDETSSTTTTLCDEQCSSFASTTTSAATTTNGVSSTLPSKLDKLVKLEWDEIDDLLQVERRVSEKDKIYETMPVRLPSTSPQNSSSSTPTSDSSKTVSNQMSTETTNVEDITSSKNSQSSSTTSPASSPSSATTSSNTTSSDNFLTATASMTTTTSTTDATTTTNNASTSTTTVDNYETSDDATLKPMDFEDFKRSVHQDYVNGANSFQEPNDDTLKRNQPIDPSRIHDSLKLYNTSGDNPMSKSFNCEHALRSIDASFINDTLALRMSEGGGSPQKRSPYILQKSGSAQAQLITNGRFEKGINRSKSGPSCVVYSSSDDDDDDSTLKPKKRTDDGGAAAGPGNHISATIRKSDIPPRFIQINMNCYPKKEGVRECDSSSKRYDHVNSSTSQSGAAAGDELTQSEEMFTAAAGGETYTNNKITHKVEHDDEEPLHITEDGVVLRRPPRTGAAAIKRRSGNRR